MSGILFDPKFDAFMAKLDMNDFTDTQPHYAACLSGPCEQGRKLCPSPEACRVPERDQMPPAWLAVLVVAVIVCIAAALAALWPHS